MLALNRARRRSVAVLQNQRMSTHSPIHGRNKFDKKKTLYPLKDQFRCMFCGGQKCPHENYMNNKKASIIGLNCDLIDDCIYASQRPSNSLIKKHNLLQVFRNNNIGLIVNLQRPGEHPYCGPNMLDKQSGYSYTPSLFVSEGIKVKLSGWKDMDVPDSLHFMLDIIKEMTFVIKELKMKVLVHCHAGYGRTGIVVACYKIFNEHLTAKEAVKRLREKRPKSIEKKTQMKYCYKFYEFVRRLREVFTNEKTDINVFLKHQGDLSYLPFTSNISIYVPRVIFVCLEGIIKLKKDQKVSNIEIFRALNGSTDINDELYANISSIATNINIGNWEDLENSTNLLILSETLFIWLDESVKACIYPFKIKEVFEMSELDDNIKKFINSEENIPKERYLEIKNYIQLILRPYEMEILNSFAAFLAYVYPYNDTSTEFEEYHYMIEKIAIFLVGYTIDLLYDKEVKQTNNIDIHNCFLIVERTIALIEFLRKIKSLEQYNQTEAKIEKKEENCTITNNNLIKKENTPDNNVKENHELSQSNYAKNNLNSSGSGGSSKYNKEKEKELYCIYQTLKKHFDGKNSKNIFENEDKNNYILNPSKFLKKSDSQKGDQIKNMNDDDYDDEDEEEEYSSSYQNDSIKESETQKENNNFFLKKRRSTTKLKYRFPIYKIPDQAEQTIKSIQNIRSPLILKLNKIEPIKEINLNNDRVNSYKSEGMNKMPVENQTNVVNCQTLCLKDNK